MHVQVKTSVVVVLHQNRMQLSRHTDHHCEPDQGHSYKNPTYDHGHYLARLDLLLLISGGLHAFHFEKWSSQLDVLEQERRTLSDDDLENQWGKVENVNVILSETETVRNESADLRVLMKTL